MAVIDAEKPLADRSVAVTYRNGTTTRGPYETYMIGIERGPLEAPANTPEYRVVERIEYRKRTTLAPGETTTVTIQTAGFDGCELVLVRWTRLDADRVTRAVPLRCDNGVLTGATTTVKSPDGGGSTGTSCQPTL